MSVRALIRRLRRAARPITNRVIGPPRDRALVEEVLFWKDYFLTKGGRFADEYPSRMEPDFPIEGRLAEIISETDVDVVRILDVGAGPATTLGKRHPTKRVEITPIDLLAREYDRMFEEIGITPPVRTVPGDAERLVEQFGAGRFDIVHARNCVDHMEDPARAIAEMLAVARPGGWVVLWHFENEGKTQGYNQLHQWNFFCRDGDLMISNSLGRTRNLSREVDALGGATTCVRVPLDEGADIFAYIKRRD